MNTYVRFLYEFLDQLLGGIVTALKGLVLGVIQMFDIRAYASLIKQYSKDFNGGEWVLVVLAVVVTIIVLALVILMVWFFARKALKFRKTLVEQESLLEEVADLQKKVVQLMKEKDELYAMKVSQLGLKPTESALSEGAGAEATLHQ